MITRMKLMMMAVGIFTAFSAGAGHASEIVVTPDLLTNASGLSVYTFDPDTAGDSTCYGGCARAWPPVLVSETKEFVAPFGATLRKDGTQQVTYRGKPLYLYIGDATPGDTTGDGIGGVWHVARP